MGRKFTVTVPRTYTFEEGWGVSIDALWSGEDDMRVEDIATCVVPIREDRVKIIDEVPCVPVYDAGMFMPVENFLHVENLTTDDTHDLRSRWFATEEEAREHETYTLRRWQNPAPWESFVQV